MDINQKLGEVIKRNGTFKFVDTVSGSLNDAVLQVEKETQFIQAMHGATVLLDDSRMMPMTSSKKDIDRMDFELDLEDGSRNASTGLITLTDQDPTFAYNRLDVEKLMAKWRLTTDAIEDNIAQGTLPNIMSSAGGAATGRSLERICIFGDKSLSAGVNVPSGYTTIDGWVHEAHADQILYGGGTANARDFDPTDIDDIFQNMYDALDPEYLEGANFYVPTSRQSSFRRSLKAKDTGLGDQAILNNAPLYFEGIPIKRVPALDYPVNSSTFAANISPEVMFLGRPNNFVHGIKRGITVKSKEDIENDLFIFVTSLRADCEFEDESKVVVAKPATTAPG